jgi:alginate O-acetyltransferase complex protein AlgJ
LKEEVVFDPKLPSLLKYDAKVLRGKNGRLFLDNDSNQVIKQYTGELLFSDRELLDWEYLLENRIAWLQRVGIHYFFLVPPNAHPVYPEDLPDAIRAAEPRPVPQLIEHLQQRGSYAELIYPLEELLAAKPNPLLYAKTDTHWTAHGAFIAYRRLMDAISSVLPVHSVSEDAIEYHESLWMGELGFKLDPKEESVTVTARIKRPLAYLVSDNRVFNRGMLVVTECPDAPPVSCVVFVDSFARAMHPFLASSFRRLVFAYAPTLDHDLILRERPDVVVSVMNERFLMTIPYDIGAPTVADFEREKKENGLRRDEIDYWSKLAERSEVAT